MEFRVEDRVQADQSPEYAVRERRSKSGKLPHKSSWVVELRSPLIEKTGKIWVGSFETKEKAKKACDAARHVLCRPPCHYTYPSGYFREIGELPQIQNDLKFFVKSYAKEYADRPLPIIAATPTVVASADSAPQVDHHALRNFQAYPTVRNVCEVGSAHNSATYPISSPPVPASSSSSTPWRECLGEIDNLLKAEDLEDPSLEDSNEYKKIRGVFQTLAREVGAGSPDAAIGSANKEAANDLTGSIDSPLASVPRLEAHDRRRQPEFARIEGTDYVNSLEHTDMCKGCASLQRIDV